MAGIFKAYDVRGKFPEEINKEIASKTAYALAKLNNPKKVLITVDVRQGSEAVKDGLIQGFLNFNPDISITFAGITSTPMMYFIFNNSEDDFDVGIVVTASHNPKEYTGMKILTKGSNGISKFINYESGLDKVEELLKENISIKEFSTDKIIKKNYVEEYYNYLENLSKISDYSSKKKIKLVCDFSNGSPVVYKNFLEKHTNLISLNDIMDGNFPGHIPNPLEKEAQEQISEKIKKTGADFGVIFDGDGDRIIFFDENGNVIDSEKIIYMMIQEMQKENKSVQSIVATINLSRQMNLALEKINVKTIESRIGYGFVRQHVIENNATLGAERAAHFSFKETGYTDSSILCILYILKLYIESEEKFSSLAKKTGITSYIEEHNVILKSDEQKEFILKKSYELFRDECNKYSNIDGHLFYYDDYWVNIRQSNTEPKVRITIESKDKETDSKIYKNILEKLDINN